MFKPISKGKFFMITRMHIKSEGPSPRNFQDISLEDEFYWPLFSIKF